jgi:1-acyl-sn-glycerol-3-phosphate acyltransferase
LPGTVFSFGFSPNVAAPLSSRKLNLASPFKTQASQVPFWLTSPAIPVMHNAMDDNRQGLWLAHGLWFHFWLIILTLMAGIMVILFRIFDRRTTLTRQITNLWGQILLKIAHIPVSVEGLEHLIPGQTYVFAANHQSQFDIFVLLEAIPGGFGWVAKKSLFQIPIFGQAMTSLGNVSIDRDNLKDAIKSLNQAAARLQSGLSLAVFPEGTRATTPELLPFKKGVFIMALKGGQPIVPISISGTLAIQPRATLHLRPGPVKVVISPPIYPQDFQGRRREELMAAVYKAIADHFDPDYPYGPPQPRG